LRGRVFGDEVAGGEYVGLMALGEDALADMPAVGCYVQDYALPLLRRGGRVRSLRYEHGFVIVGDDVRTFFEENLRWLDRERAGESFVGAGAIVSRGVELERSLVGSGARVDGDGVVARSLVFPGVHCLAPLSETLVSPTLTLTLSSLS
jgi:hypothetical protein